MNKLYLAIAILVLSNNLQAGDFGKLRDKIKKESANLKEDSKKLTDKAKAWGEHMESRNAEDIQEIEARFKEIWGNVDTAVNKALSDVEAEGKRVTATLENDWKTYKEKRKSEAAAPQVPALSNDAKVEAGQRVYEKLNVEEFAKGGETSFETFVKTYENALQQQSLDVADAAYVKSKTTGDTLLHSLVSQAYDMEAASLRAKQVAQLKGGDASESLEENIAYKQTLLAISYFAEVTQMGAEKNIAGKLPVEIVLDKTPISLILAQHLVIHDLTNASKSKFNELFPRQ